MRTTIRALIISAGVLVGLGSLGAAGAVAASTPVKVAGVKLTSGVGTGAQRSYEATVFDTAGNPVAGADLDLGGLAGDPDLRVKTTKMTATTADPLTYRVTVNFPADGDWVMVVRVHAPTQAVELFSEKISGAGTAVSSHDLASNPSRRAVLRADPTFYQRYNGTSELGTVSPAGTAGASRHSGLAGDAGSGTLILHDSEFSATAAGFAMAHTFGALAWTVSVLGLVLANRLGSGGARTEITRFISRHYLVLAGGGLLVLVFSGVQTALYASVGLRHPTQLLDTRLGTAYLAVFALKMVLVLGSLITTWRLGRLLPTPARLLATPRLASLGAMANEDPSPFIFRLAEANASFGALIIGCVVILGQLHHALL